MDLKDKLNILVNNFKAFVVFDAEVSFQQLIDDFSEETSQYLWESPTFQKGEEKIATKINLNRIIFFGRELPIYPNTVLLSYSETWRLYWNLQTSQA